MKIERTENSIKFLPESEWEKTNLKELRQKSIQSIKFEDDWDSKGYLELVFTKHSWDKN